MSPTRSFASDNNSGIHPEALEALNRANEGHELAYGGDPYTARAEQLFKQHFGAQAEAFLVFNGTAANVLSLKALTESHHSIICTDLAHIYGDECGAPERVTGCKLLPVATPDGKLTPALIARHCRGIGDQHHVQAKVISITQSTEIGTVYGVDEIRALSSFARERSMYLHVDGARICNAAASLGLTLKELTTDLGIDVLSFGGTKNGLLGAEAVVFLSPATLPPGALANFKYVRKQTMQLSSKMRFASAQFDALLGGDLWLRNARHSNAMAQLLAHELESVPQVLITQKVQANGVFLLMPIPVIEKLREKCFFYTWNEDAVLHQGNECNEVRLMCSFDTTAEDIRGLIHELKTLLSA